MNIYVAGPMRGIPEFNFPAFFAAEGRLTNLGHNVFNPARRDNDVHGTDISKGNEEGCEDKAGEEHGFDLREALAADCAWICQHADGIFMLLDWQGSKGATAEKALAHALGLHIFYEVEADYHAR